MPERLRSQLERLEVFPLPEEGDARCFGTQLRKLLARLQVQRAARA